MGDAGAMVQQGVHLTLIDVDAVGRQHLGAEDVLLLHIRDDRHAILGAGVLNFYGGFGDMRVQGHVELNGQFCCKSQDLICTCVR